jgi:hypothetical protein
MTNRRILAIIVWLAAELLLQIHGICFWIEHGGLHGWLWSVVLCVATVWFWLHHHRAIRYTFGVLASLLLLAGPLWQVGAPLVDAMEQRNAQQRNVTLQLETLRNSATLQVATLQTFLRNSEARTGWAPLIVAAQDDLAATRMRIADVVSTPPAARAAFLSVAVIVIQLAALIVLQVAAVAALLVIRCASGVALPDAQVVDGSGIHVLKRGETLHYQQTKKPANKFKNVDEVKQRIASGVYGQQPSMRKVIDGEKGLRHPETRALFHDLVAEGILVAVGQRFRLATG